MDEQSHKPHRKAKPEKKHASGERNPKAFAVSNPGKLARQAARSQDIREKSLHVPLVDRLPEEAPPRLVTIVGPPGVGKTTLVKSLVRRYAKESMTDPQGPITVVTSKKQRLTFVECPNELEAMVDMAKIADIVLLMIDGNYGFEMETMEFLNILSATGMPGNVFGILTHLDLFRKPQQLKDAKKRLKHRLWRELYAGAHLFYLSGVINGRYPDREVQNLSRFLSVMKNPRPLIWRNSHPYTIIDSFRDVTHPTQIEADDKCDRTIALSGYLRGTNFSAEGQRVHIPGLGDFNVKAVETLPDPCPTPQMELAIAKVTGKVGRRRLDEKEKKLHAPMSDRSGLKIDGDAIWITRDKGFTFNKEATEIERGEGEELIIGLQGERRLLGQTEDGMQLFRDGEKITSVPEEEDTGRKSQRTARLAEREEGEDDFPEDEGFASGDDNEGDEDEDAEFDEKKLGKMFRKDIDKNGDEDEVAFADSDSDLGSLSGADDDDDEEDSEDELDDDDEESAALRWKENMTERAQKLHGGRRSYRTGDLARMMYDESITADEVLRRWKGEVDADEEEEEDIEADSDDEEFFKKAKQESDDASADDRAVPVYDYEQLAAKWSVADNVELLRQRFTTATLNGADGEDGDDGFEGFDNDSEGDGEFEDLETGEKHKAEAEAAAASLEEERAKNAKRKEELKLRFEEEDREGFANDKANARREVGQNPDEFGEDDWYDAQKALIQKQLDINNAEFGALDERQRVAVEGYKAGKYAKLIIDGVPAEFVQNFNAKLPVIVGGLAPTEDRFGYVQVENQAPQMAQEDSEDKRSFDLQFGVAAVPNTSHLRHIRFTNKESHAQVHAGTHALFATVYAPLIAPNTGFVCFNSFSSSNPGFRIAATGTVLSVDESSEIVKKLKLTGVPYKVFKNTAFIKDMFNSSLEIAKFEGAAIKTVSGIRGQIKRALSKPEGHFRATFEDKILMSDIVFLRTWYPIKPHRYYNVVTNLLGGWQGMRLTGEVRRDQGIATPQDKNSKYRTIERKTRHFNSLKVPRALAASLPYKSQIVQMKPQRHETYMQKRAVVLGGEEKKARDLLQKITTIRKDTEAKRAAKKAENRAKFKKKMETMNDKKEAREKREKKEYWEREGKKRKAGDEGGGGKRRR